MNNVYSILFCYILLHTCQRVCVCVVTWASRRREGIYSGESRVFEGDILGGSDTWSKPSEFTGSGCW